MIYSCFKKILNTVTVFLKQINKKYVFEYSVYDILC